MDAVGVFSWLRSLFRRPVVRDVSALGGDDAALTVEVVDTSGGPLKPNHRRLALRDPRLLPKAKGRQGANSWSRRKKAKIMDADEANRLFSDTMRTNDRKIRDLAHDPEQLQRYGLPQWTSEMDVARALGLTLKQLRYYSIHRHRETTSHYVAFAIPKRDGGHRIIHAPKKQLKQIHRTLNQKLVSKLPVSSFAQGFLRKRSVATNAGPHVGKTVVIRLDLKDCFPSIHFGRVRGLLISLGYSYHVATCLSVLMTEAPRQPVEAEGKIYHVPVGPRACVQGAPTSPGLCNSVLMRLDRRLAGVAKKYGYSYTRYADDMTLSGDDPARAKPLINFVRKIVAEEGFQLNESKTRILRRGQCQRVTGVVVNETAGLSRTQRRRLRAAIHQLNPNDDAKRRHLEGKLAYLQMLNADQAKPLQQAFAKVCGG